jgi:glycosyltransferase involved in cell wall biosynthesis
LDTPERPSVLHVLAPAPFGGAESVVRDLVRGLSGRGVPVGVALLLEGEETHPYERVLAEAGAEVHPIRTPARAYRRESRALAELFLRRRPGVVHTHGFRPDIQAGRVAGRAGIPRVTTLHGFTGGGARMQVYEWLQVRKVRRFEAVVVVSRPLEARMRRAGVPAARLHLLRNAWSRGEPALARAAARAELGLPQDAFAIGWVGRLSAEKGGDVFVEALARLGDVPFVACVVGDGPDRAALEARAARLGLGGRVRWCGVRPQAGRLFGAFDAFVLSSRTEGTPIVLLEAMQAGVPIVATSVGGVPDVVSSEEAWLVASEDPHGVAAALRALRADAAEGARRAQAARRRLAADFADAPWLDAYLRIYREARAR